VQNPDFRSFWDARRAKAVERRNRVSRKINGLEFQCGIADARKLADLLAFPSRACARCKNLTCPHAKCQLASRTSARAKPVAHCGLSLRAVRTLLQQNFMGRNGNGSTIGLAACRKRAGIL
jgi:hypothetical protein